MNRVVILDTGPLGLVTHPGSKPEVKECQAWLQSLLGEGIRFLVPAIADYELRRELIRANQHRGLARLEALVQELGSISIDQEVIREAATLWAEARRQGLPTAPDLALDGDCFLAAQANTTLNSLIKSNDFDLVRVIVATTNPRHLERMTRASHWRDLTSSFA